MQQFPHKKNLAKNNEDFVSKAILGKVTAVTGFEKSSGKTAFVNYLALCGRLNGSVSLATIGSDLYKDPQRRSRKPELAVFPGDVIITTLPQITASSSLFEILETMPGRVTLGKMVIAKAKRQGNISLVGTEHLKDLKEALELIQKRKWANSLIVDGAVNRVTQISSLGNVQFAYTAIVEKSNISKVASKFKMLDKLSKLPLLDLNHHNLDGKDIFKVEGPLTDSVLKNIPKNVTTVACQDFTKVFLDPGSLDAVLTQATLCLCNPFRLLCFSVALKGISKDSFINALGEDFSSNILFNPYSV